MGPVGLRTVEAGETLVTGPTGTPDTGVVRGAMGEGFKTPSPLALMYFLRKSSETGLVFVAPPLSLTPEKSNPAPFRIVPQ